MKTGRKRSVYTPGPIEKLTIRQILDRNFGRQSEMVAALVRSVEGSIQRGDNEERQWALAKEAIRHLDRHAEQIQGVQ